MWTHNISNSLSRSYESTPLTVEFVRVSTVKGRKRKNNAQVKLPLKISLPGSSIDFQPIATVHHLGGIDSGHWVSRILLSTDKWIECDHLKLSQTVVPVDNSCMVSGTVVLVMLVPVSHFV